MYREDEDSIPREKKIDALLDIGKYLAKFQAGATKKEESEYAYLVNEARKITGDTWFVMHKRMERAFVGASVSFIVSNLRDWVTQVQKATDVKNPAALFNWYFNQYRNKQKQK